MHACYMYRYHLIFSIFYISSCLPHPHTPKTCGHDHHHRMHACMIDYACFMTSYSHVVPAMRNTTHIHAIEAGVCSLAGSTEQSMLLDRRHLGRDDHDEGRQGSSDFERPSHQERGLDRHIKRLPFRSNTGSTVDVCAFLRFRNLQQPAVTKPAVTFHSTDPQPRRSH